MPTHDDPAASLPRVSVCIPTYNGAGTIAATMASVLAQQFGDFELIVVDDGSRDETAAIVAGFKDPRIRYLRNQRNLGPQGNWNRCLELATGHYVKVLPHDDLLHPRCLERQVAVLDADAEQQLALVFCARAVIGPDGRVLLKKRGYRGGVEGRVPAAVLVGACVRRGVNVIGEPGAVLFRRQLARRIGGFDATNSYVIDLDYWVRLLAHGDAHYCDEALASFRVWAGSWSVAIGAGQSSDYRNFVRRLEVAGALKGSRFDRFVGRFTPQLNQLARLLFYRLFL
jgi:glycosyltransferase involved in cell wall biosynthesis